MRKAGFVICNGIHCYGEIAQLNKKKANKPWTPIFEAFSNSWESVSEFFGDRNPVNETPRITLEFKYKKNESNNTEPELNSITISDNGRGFDEVSYKRFINLRDGRKGRLNKGTGRLQYLRYFSKIQIESSYSDDSNSFRKCEFIFSDAKEFLDRNSFIKVVSDEKIDKPTLHTSVHFLYPKIKRTEYADIDVEKLKDIIIRHYLVHFYRHREHFPSIQIIKYVNDNVLDNINISETDIPSPKRSSQFKMQYLLSPVKPCDEIATFYLHTFEYNDNVQPKNILQISTNGGAAGGLSFSCMKESDSFFGKRYMFVLESDYFDSKCEGDERGVLVFPSFDRRTNQGELFPVLIPVEDIEDRVNEQILNDNEVIREKFEQVKRDVDNLRKKFLLDPETIRGLKFNANDSEEQMLSRIYQADAKIEAKRDATISSIWTELDTLMPSDKNYIERLEALSQKLTSTTTFESRVTLASYVARRKIVLELFEKLIRDNVLETELHNLIMQKHASNTSNSELWIFSEDYLCYSGVSEFRFDKMKINGECIFKSKSKLTDEEINWISSLDLNRSTHRPDILLFPSEGKAIIIEFKEPKRNLSECLGQIERYAGYILNMTTDQHKFKQFYGYLIGEKIDNKDLLMTDSDYIESEQGESWYRPPKKVPGFFGHENGSIYSEVLKYSTLLNRAKVRNKAFQDRLFPSNDD